MKKIFIVLFALLSFNVSAQSNVEKLSIDNYDFEIVTHPVSVVVFHMPLQMGSNNRLALENLAYLSQVYMHNATYGFYRVDAINEFFLAGQLKLKNYPTTVFYQNGEIVKEVEGLMYVDELIEVLQGL